MSLVRSLKEEGANTAAKVKQSAGDEAASFMQHPQKRSRTRTELKAVVGHSGRKEMWPKPIL